MPVKLVAVARLPFAALALPSVTVAEPSPAIAALVVVSYYLSSTVTPEIVTFALAIVALVSLIEASV